jgi:hypothetical protein
MRQGLDERRRRRFGSSGRAFAAAASTAVSSLEPLTVVPVVAAAVMKCGVKCSRWWRDRAGSLGRLWQACCLPIVSTCSTVQ